MAQFLAFVPKTLAFYVYVANARSSPKALRFKYMRRTRVRTQTHCVLSMLRTRIRPQNPTVLSICDEWAC